MPLFLRLMPGPPPPTASTNRRVSTPLAAPISRAGGRPLNDPCAQQFGRAGGRDAVTVMVGWLIRVTNCCCSILLSPRANLPPFLPLSPAISPPTRRRTTCENEGLNLAERIPRSSSPHSDSVSDLQIFTTTSLCEGDGASDERDSHNHNDNSNGRTDEGEGLCRSVRPDYQLRLKGA